MPSLSKSSLALPWRRRVGLCEAEAEKDKVHIGSKSVREGVGILGGRSSFLDGRKEERKEGRKEIECVQIQTKQVRSEEYYRAPALATTHNSRKAKQK